MREVPAGRFDEAQLPRGRVAVLFCADWCGYCLRFLPRFRGVPEGWLVDVSDEDDPLWDAYAIEVVPTVVLFVDGKPERRWAGALGAHHMEEILVALRA